MWAAAQAAGIPNELYWELTLDEVRAVLREHTEAERRANRRAALIAATIVNVQPGRRQAVTIEDFLDSEGQYMTVEEAEHFMRGWVADRNAAAAATPKAPS